ncbi:type-F conjugative transfer system pilin assembly protein TraF [Arsenophonus nasoniae]|uniref:Type-F conjugative transfer system pilin assembly protein TraF n=1 Tax=Arsenophonus nasoniae TaxID=638 RepID=A0AA95KBK8_9GAMM|nr:type-F conjugative transfer system pilin assembly protein TraF [Arsenophonus nasoniae]WGM03301.1 type-F conjugative transfer system pilin assembly protein TraF [Arsenophonus nasoniae]WGM03366.1 type-F conjugative transfer system pilin assembly protein TraF [Arsenophonus nasoniae]
MKRLLLSSVLLSAIVTAKPDDGYHYSPAVGWHWYNEPAPQQETLEAPSSPQKTLSAVETMQKIKALGDELRNAAVLDPKSPEKLARWIAFQNYWSDNASQFSATWQKVLLLKPELDYNNRHSHYNATATLSYANERKAQATAIKAVNERYGVFFFYRGNAPLDNKLAQVVREFAQQYQMAVMPISVDGVINPELPNSQKDRGQAAKMQIRYFPALFLVDPSTGSYHPLAYGFISQDDLAKRLLNRVTDFAPRD